jgi:hypothetical protein
MGIFYSEAFATVIAIDSFLSSSHIHKIPCTILPSLIVSSQLDSCGGTETDFFFGKTVKMAWNMML